MKLKGRDERGQGSVIPIRRQVPVVLDQSVTPSQEAPVVLDRSVTPSQEVPVVLDRSVTPSQEVKGDPVRTSEVFIQTSAKIPVRPSAFSVLPSVLPGPEDGWAGDLGSLP